MRDGDDSAALRERFERALDVPLALRVERACGLVEKEDRRVFQQRPSDGDALLLATRQHAALVADHCVVAVRLREDELVRERLPRRFINLLRRRVEPAVLDVFENAFVKQKRVLRDDRDVFAQRLLRHLAKVVSVDADDATRRIVETQNQREHRAFARAALADERVGFARLDAQFDVAHGRDAGVVFERDIFDGNAAAAVLQRDGFRRVLHARLRLHQLENARRGGEAFLELHVNAAEFFRRLVKHEQTRDEAEEFRRADVLVPHVKQRHADADGRDRLDHRADDLDRFAHANRVAELRAPRFLEALHFIILATERLDDFDPRERLAEDNHHRAGLLLLVASGFAHAPPVHDDRHKTDGKKHEADDREPPVERHQHGDRGDDRDRLRDDIAADLRERGLRLPRVVGDAREKIARALFVKKIERLPDDVREQARANIDEQLQTHPRHAVGVQVTEHAAEHHHSRDERANPEHVLDARSARVRRGFRHRGLARAR